MSASGTGGSGPNPGGSRWTTLEKSLGLAAAVLTLVAAWLGVLQVRGGNSDEAAVAAKITGLANVIGKPAPIGGTVKGLKGGEAVWIFNRSVEAGGQLFHPERRQCPIDGDSWQCPAIFVGTDNDGRSYDVVAIVVDGGVQRQLADYLTSDACNARVCYPIPLPDALARDSKTIRRE
jgi:hypothetical protein